MRAPTIFHLPVSPSSRRLEIPPTPEVGRDAVSFRIVDHDDAPGRALASLAAEGRGRAFGDHRDDWTVKR